MRHPLPLAAWTAATVALPGGLIGEGEGAKMKDMALTDEFVVHFAFPEQNIRAGVPVKGEGAVSAGVQLDKGQGGVDFFGGHQSPGINTVGAP